MFQQLASIAVHFQTNLGWINLVFPIEKAEALTAGLQFEINKARRP